MSTFFAYTRVSTRKQGQEGVSLPQQRDEIALYAQKHGLIVTQWFEEQESASKKGRPIFNAMMERIARSEASGLIIHKIDRSVRNLSDWTRLCELVDEGLSLHVVSEHHQLSSRGVRLAADIQAVVAADYARNLRLEVLKGIEGRYKQGLLPGPAPLGYENNGGGKPKTIDPIKGPLIREMFELYATGRYSLHSLRDLMNERGLRNRQGNQLSINGLSCLLKKTFYTGVIRTTQGKTYPGAHDALVSVATFQRVQEVLAGKDKKKSFKHEFTYSRSVKCSLCGYSLIGELQKGCIYYRCHTRGCPMTSLREEVIEEHLKDFLKDHSLGIRVVEPLLAEIRKREKLREEIAQATRQQMSMNKARLDNRLANLTDLYLDADISKDEYIQKREKLEDEIALVAEQMTSHEKLIRQKIDSVVKILELATSLVPTYFQATTEEKRQMVKNMTSNFLASPKCVEIEPSPAWAQVAKVSNLMNGEPSRGEPRTLESIINLMQNGLTDLI